MNQVMGLTTEKSGFDCSYVYEISSSSKMPRVPKGASQFSTNAYWRFVCPEAN